jgi:FixJ family two-component response regulator
MVSEMSMNPHIVIIDDEESVRRSLSSVLLSYGFKTTSYPDAEGALQEIDPLQTDCVLLDVRMPDIDGLTAQKIFSDITPELPVVMISGHGDIAMAVRAVKAGAFDFIEKPINDELLVASIRAAIGARKKTSKGNKQLVAVKKRYELLTSREKSVASLVAEGYTTAAIAATLNISARTVDHHRASILAKLQATSLPQLIRFLLMVSPLLERHNR